MKGSSQPYPDIRFKPHLTYAEKLLLKKHRRTDLQSYEHSSASSGVVITEINSDGSDVAEMRESTSLEGFNGKRNLKRKRIA